MKNLVLQISAILVLIFTLISIPIVSYITLPQASVLKSADTRLNVAPQKSDSAIAWFSQADNKKFFGIPKIISKNQTIIYIAPTISKTPEFYNTENGYLVPINSNLGSYLTKYAQRLKLEQTLMINQINGDKFEIIRKGQSVFFLPKIDQTKIRFEQLPSDIYQDLTQKIKNNPELNPKLIQEDFKNHTLLLDPTHINFDIILQNIKSHFKNANLFFEQSVHHMS